MKRKLATLITAQAAAANSKICFTQSKEAYGADLGIQESDFSTLTKANALTQAHRIKAVMICEGKNNKLIGIQLQLGVAHKGQFYDSITLRSFGNTVYNSDTCKVITVTPGQGIEQMELLYDGSGLAGASFLMSDSTVAITGGSGVSPTLQSKLLVFTPEEQLIGFWGLERYSVSKLGFITLDTPCAIKNMPAWIPPGEKPVTPVKPTDKLVKPVKPVKPVNPDEPVKPVTPFPEVTPKDDDTSMIVMAVLVSLVGLGIIIGGIFGIKIYLARKDRKEKVHVTPVEESRSDIMLGNGNVDEEAVSRIQNSSQIILLPQDVSHSEMIKTHSDADATPSGDSENEKNKATIMNSEPDQEPQQPDSEPSKIIHSLQSRSQSVSSNVADFISKEQVLKRLDQMEVALTLEAAGLKKIVAEGHDSISGESVEQSASVLKKSIEQLQKESISVESTITAQGHKNLQAERKKLIDQDSLSVESFNRAESAHQSKGEIQTITNPESAEQLVRLQRAGSSEWQELIVRQKSQEYIISDQSVDLVDELDLAQQEKAKVVKHEGVQVSKNLNVKRNSLLGASTSLEAGPAKHLITPTQANIMQHENEVVISETVVVNDLKEEPQLIQVIDTLSLDPREQKLETGASISCNLDDNIDNIVVQENEFLKDKDDSATAHRNAWVDEVKTVDTLEERKTQNQSQIMILNGENEISNVQHRQFSYDTPLRQNSNVEKVLDEDLVVVQNDTPKRSDRGRPVSQNERNYWYTMDKPDILVQKKKKFRQKSGNSLQQSKQSAEKGQVLMTSKVAQKDYLDLVQVLKNLQEKKSLNHLSKLDEKLLRKIKVVVANNPEHYSSKTGYLQLVYNQGYKDI